MISMANTVKLDEHGNLCSSFVCQVLFALPAAMIVFGPLPSK
jgi:hypothetical protein